MKTYFGEVSRFGLGFLFFQRPRLGLALGEGIHFWEKMGMEPRMQNTNCPLEDCHM